MPYFLLWYTLKVAKKQKIVRTINTQSAETMVNSSSRSLSVIGVGRTPTGSAVATKATVKIKPVVDASRINSGKVATSMKDIFNLWLFRISFYEIEVA